MVHSYRPVVLMHGILAGPSDMKDIMQFIDATHPGTPVLVVDAFNDMESLTTKMTVQVKGVWQKIQQFVDNATDGVNMICFSQGGLVCRGILEQFSEAKVNTFISLSSPQAGQFGDTEYMKWFFPNFTRDHLYLVLYNEVGQDLSLANYWNDPHHQDLYKQYCEFLPPLNNGSISVSARSNFLKLEQLVLIGGPDDGVIQPWQSSHFGFYDESLTVLPMTSQDFYKDDSFGLRTLNQQGKVKVYEIPGVKHIHWHLNQSVFDCCIEPWLK